MTAPTVIIDLMANDELNAAAVEETPTSYNSKGQAIMMVGIGVLLVILIVYSVSNSRSDREAKQEALAIQATPSSAGSLSSTEKFDKQVDDQRKQLQRTQYSSTEDIKNHIDQSSEDLRQQNNFLIDQLTQQTKTPIQAWREQAEVRVRESRHSGFGFKYFEDGQGQAATRAGQPTAATNTDAFIAQEDARLTQLQGQLDQDLSALATTDPSTDDLSLFQNAERPASAATDMLNVAGVPGSDLGSAWPVDKLLLSIGSVFTGTLDQKVVSDYIGPYRAIITHNVMDVSGRYVLIPAGSRVTGNVLHINNINQVINNRMGMTVTWIVRPDGSKVKFVSRALDSEGIGAIKGSTNYHLLAKFGGVAAFALLSSETDRADFSSDGQGRTFGSDTGEAFREQGTSIAQSYAGLVPTQTLHQGTPLRFFVSEDIYIAPWRSVFSKFVSND
jgi:type IV secretion system protein TrbI